MTATKAVDLLLAKFPGLTVAGVKDYDDTHFVIIALKDLTKKDYDCPMYSVDKNTGEVGFFTPMLDIERFARAPVVDF